MRLTYLFWLCLALTTLVLPGAPQPLCGGQGKEKPPAQEKHEKEIVQAVHKFFPGLLDGMMPDDFTNKHSNAKLVSQDKAKNVRRYQAVAERSVLSALFVDGRLISMSDVLRKKARTADEEKKEALQEAKDLARTLGKPDVDGPDRLPRTEREMTPFYNRWVVEEAGLAFELAVRVIERPDGKQQFWTYRAASDLTALKKAERKGEELAELEKEAKVERVVREFFPGVIDGMKPDDFAKKYAGAKLVEQNKASSTKRYKAGDETTGVSALFVDDRPIWMTDMFRNGYRTVDEAKKGAMREAEALARTLGKPDDDIPDPLPPWERGKTLLYNRWDAPEVGLVFSMSVRVIEGLDGTKEFRTYRTATDLTTMIRGGIRREPPAQEKDAKKVVRAVGQFFPGLGRMKPEDFPLEYAGAELVSQDKLKNVKRYQAGDEGLVLSALFVDGRLVSMSDVSRNECRTAIEEERESLRVAMDLARTLGKPDVDDPDHLPKEERGRILFYNRWVAEEDGIAFELAVRVIKGPDGKKRFWTSRAASDLTALKKAGHKGEEIAGK